MSDSVNHSTDLFKNTESFRNRTNYCSLFRPMGRSHLLSMGHSAD